MLRHILQESVKTHMGFQFAGQWRPADEQLVKKALADAKPGAQAVAGAPATVLLGQTVEQLQNLAVEQFEQPKYRGKQLYDALFHGVTSVNDINQVRFSASAQFFLRSDLSSCHLKPCVGVPAQCSCFLEAWLYESCTPCLLCTHPVARSLQTAAFSNSVDSCYVVDAIVQPL